MWSMVLSIIGAIAVGTWGVQIGCSDDIIVLAMSVIIAGGLAGMRD